METQDKDQIIAALLESNEILQTEVTNTRNTNRLLRRVNSALRSSITSMRQQIEAAMQNDDMFKRFCAGEFDAKGTASVEGGLPNTEAIVESTAIDGEEALAPNTPHERIAD